MSKPLPSSIARGPLSQAQSAAALSPSAKAAAHSFKPMGGLVSDLMAKIPVPVGVVKQ